MKARIGDGRWLWSTVGSLSIHGGVVAAAALGFNWVAASEPPPAAAVVVEVSLVTSAPPVPVRETPPGPEQQEQQAAQKRPLMEIPHIPAPLVPVKAEVVVPLRDDRPPQKVEDDARRVDVTTAPTAMPAPSAPDFAAPAVGRSANPPSNAEQAWEGLVLAQLERNKRYPAAAQRAGMQDVVMVRLTLDRKGRVTDAKIRRSNGYGPLDAEVLALARRASPLPAPPPEVAGDPLVLTVPVEFFMKKRGR